MVGEEAGALLELGRRDPTGVVAGAAVGRLRRAVRSSTCRVEPEGRCSRQ
jgi:hypothetical protein